MLPAERSCGQLSSSWRNSSSRRSRMWRALCEVLALPHPTCRAAENARDRRSDQLLRPLHAANGNVAQLLQGRALATQLQLPPSGLRQLVTLPRARDHQAYPGPSCSDTSRRQSDRAAMPAVARRRPVARPSCEWRLQSASAYEAVTSIPAASTAAPAAPCNTLRATMTDSPFNEFSHAATSNAPARCMPPPTPSHRGSAIFEDSSNGPLRDYSRFPAFPQDRRQDRTRASAISTAT